jgi:hypothetical protein
MTPRALPSPNRFTVPVGISAFPRLRRERAAEGVQSQDRYSLQLLLDPRQHYHPAGASHSAGGRDQRRVALEHRSGLPRHRVGNDVESHDVRRHAERRPGLLVTTKQRSPSGLPRVRAEPMVRHSGFAQGA